MKHLVAAAAAGVLLAVAGPVIAQTQGSVVVELYTSQGCSSCPPADEILGNLTKDPDVIPLSLHVDYWDYLGWKDKFGNAKFTARQKAYAHHAKDRMVYTPQIVVQGSARMVGSRASEVANSIKAEKGNAAPVRLSLARNGSRLTISAEAVTQMNRPLRVQLVRYSPSESVAIKHGENAGRTLTYHNVVTSWQQVGQWNGQSPLILETDASGGDPLVVIIQAEGPAEILAAARLR